MRNSCSAYLFTYNTRWKLVSISSVSRGGPEGPRPALMDPRPALRDLKFHCKKTGQIEDIVNVCYHNLCLLYKYNVPNLGPHHRKSCYATGFYLNYKCGFYSPDTLIQSGQTNTHTTIVF